MIRDADGRIIRIRYVLPRHKAANWVGRGRGRKSTRPGANGVVAVLEAVVEQLLAERVAVEAEAGRRGKNPRRHEKNATSGKRRAIPETAVLSRGRPGRREHAVHEPLVSRATRADVPLAGLSFAAV